MEQLKQNFSFLKLNFLAENFEQLFEQAKEKKLDRVDFVEQLVLAEVAEKRQRAVERRIKAARIPVLKTLDHFNLAYPEKIDAEAVRYLFRLHFLEECKNIIFCGCVGLGKTHLASALALEACNRAYSTLFISAVEIINTLNEAQKNGRLSRALRKLINVKLLVIDELGYMPIDKKGCDLLFQVISGRYEKGSTIFTTNRTYKEWSIIFNNDAVVTSAILDRVLHHSETIKIEGPSYRMSDNK